MSDNLENENNLQTCNICLEKYSSNEFQSIWICNHYFHNTCITNWINTAITPFCPLCRCEEFNNNVQIENNNYNNVLNNEDDYYDYYDEYGINPDNNLNDNLDDNLDEENDFSETYIDNMQGNGARDILFYKNNIEYTYVFHHWDSVSIENRSMSFEKGVVDHIIREWDYTKCNRQFSNDHKIDIKIPFGLYAKCSCGSVQGFCMNMDLYSLI